MPAMRRAGATARAMLVQAAAKKLGVPAGEAREVAHRPLPPLGD